MTVSLGRSPTTVSPSLSGLNVAMDGSRPLSTLVRSFLGSPFYSPHQAGPASPGWPGYLNPGPREAFRGPKQRRTSQFTVDFGRDRFAFSIRRDACSLASPSLRASSLSPTPCPACSVFFPSSVRVPPPPPPPPSVSLSRFDRRRPSPSPPPSTQLARPSRARLDAYSRLDTFAVFRGPWCVPEPIRSPQG